MFHVQVKAEDRGVERAAALAADERVRIAASDTIESLLETDFRLIINDTEYHVKTPPQVSAIGIFPTKHVVHRTLLRTTQYIYFQRTTIDRVGYNFFFCAILTSFAPFRVTKYWT